jgi:hypothetical protein
MTSLQQTALGGGSTTAKTASYTLVAADAGTVVQMSSATATTITVNQNLFAQGDSVQIQNVGAGVCTITPNSATVNTSSTLALSQYDGGTLYFNTTSAAFFFAFDAADSSAAAAGTLTGATLASNVLASSLTSFGTTPALTTPTISTATTNGDILYGTGSGALQRLGIGSTNQVLGVTSGVPAYQASSKSTLTTTGDILYASAANTPARLAAGTSGYVLTSGGASTAPSWAAASSGGMTLLSTTSLSGASVTISVTTSSYNFLYLEFVGVTYTSGGGNTILEMNGGGNNYFDGYTIIGNTVTNVPLNSACNFGNQGSGETGGGAFWIYGNLSGGFKTYQTMWRASGFSHINSSGGISLTSAITSFKITNSGYTLSGGTCKIYGGN